MENLDVDYDEKTSLLKAAEDGASTHLDEPSCYSTAASMGDAHEQSVQAAAAAEKLKSRSQ